MPQLSIIVPVYNSLRKGLQKCIDSILNQTYKDYELVIINDGSTDGSELLCMELAKTDSRIKLVNTANAGVSKARNRGLVEATGEYITFIDSDDVMNADYISKLMSAVENCDLTVCGIKQIFPDNHTKTYLPPGERFNLRENDWLHRLLQSRLMFGPCNKIFKKNIIQANDIQFPENIDYGEDRIFCFNYLKHTEWVRCVSNTKYEYLIQEGDSLSTKERDNLFDLEYDQWQQMHNLYNYLSVFTQNAAYDVFEELYWMVSDEINRSNSRGVLTMKRIKQLLAIPELKQIKKFNPIKRANPFMRWCILNKCAIGVKIFYKLQSK